MKHPFLSAIFLLVVVGLSAADTDPVGIVCSPVVLNSKTGKTAAAFFENFSDRVYPAVRLSDRTVRQVDTRFQHPLRLTPRKWLRRSAAPVLFDGGVTLEAAKEAAEAKDAAEQEVAAEQQTASAASASAFRPENASLGIALDDASLHLFFRTDCAPGAVLEVRLAVCDPQPSEESGWHWFIRETYGRHALQMNPDGKFVNYLSRLEKDGVRTITLSLPRREYERIGAASLLRLQVFRWFEDSGAVWGTADSLPGVGSAGLFLTLPPVSFASRREDDMAQFRRAATQYYQVRKNYPQKGAESSLEEALFGWIEFRGLTTTKTMREMYGRSRRIGFLLPGMAKLFLAESGEIARYRAAMKEAAKSGMDDLKNVYLRDYVTQGVLRDFQEPSAALERLCLEAMRDKLFQRDYPDCEVNQ